MHDIAAEGIHKAQQEVEPGSHPNIHHVSVPLLVRRTWTEVIFPTGSLRELPARQQIRLAQNSINRAFPHTNNLRIPHNPRQLSITNLRMPQRELADRRTF